MDLLIGTAIGALAWDGTGTSTLIQDARVNHLARDGDGWWGVDGEGRLHHDGEVVGRAGEGVALNCIQPGEGVVWVGANQARLFRHLDESLVEDQGFARAPGRERWYTPWGGPPDVRSLTTDGSGTLYVNVHVGGILRYDDETGPVPTIDPDADVHQVLAHPRLPGTVVAASAYGLARSRDGERFDILAEGLHASYCRAVTIVDEVVIVSASTGPRSDRGRLYRVPLDGDHLEPRRAGLPEWFPGNLDTHCLVTRDGVVYAGQGGTVWASEDQGETWEGVVAELPPITCLA